MLTFVITGTLSKPRDAFRQLIESRGHQVSNSVTSKTDYLLAGYDAGSKLNKAFDMRIPVIGERHLTEVLATAQAQSDRAARSAGPANRTIYLFSTDEHGENQAMFDESFNLIGAWHSNDAAFRPEYMAGWLKALGIVVKPLPANRQSAALNALCDHMGYGDDFGD